MAWKIIELETCSSTSTMVKQYLQAGTLADKTAIMAAFQDSGRGQGDHSWHSKPHENLLVSFFRETNFAASESFFLTMITSLAVRNLLNNLGIDCQIKWPNDIYFQYKKIAGILIENSLLRDRIIHTIAGIGLNVNQTEFPEEIPNPVSMKNIHENTFPVKELCLSLTQHIDTLWEDFEKGKKDIIYHEYVSLIYRLKEWHPYGLKNRILNGRILGVEPNGRLLFETSEGQLLHLEFGEISYLL
ncbi:MAG: biotin--[acetyl-CoA-carboxylase] ligase [Bacteroidota bacterium]|nr:MAG: biotin--[acetyl-CoA-carboxylase] ligase [Bacteroidota bacterium]